jgi:hypothetical protein
MLIKTMSVRLFRSIEIYTPVVAGTERIYGHEHDAS